MNRTADTTRLEAIIMDLIAHSHEEEWFEFKTNRVTDHEIGEFPRFLTQLRWSGRMPAIWYGELKTILIALSEHPLISIKM